MCCMCVSVAVAVHVTLGAGWIVVLENANVFSNSFSVLYLVFQVNFIFICRSRSQVGGEPSLLQKVPEKYFVVKNDEFVRVKYVLVFETQKQM